MSTGIKILKIERVDNNPDEFEPYISKLVIEVEGDTNRVLDIQKMIINILGD